MRKYADLVAGESRWFPVSIAIAAVALTPTAAHASSKLLNAKSLLSSKASCPVAASYAAPARIDISRAILGGAPSALDRIRSDQQGAEAPSPPAIAVPVTASLNNVPVRQTLEPASRNPVSFALRDAGNCNPRSIFDPLPETGAEYDATAELGTRAIPVKRTRFDDRWDHVRRAAPAGLMQGQLRRANAARA